jgi:hypothetical protein
MDETRFEDLVRAIGMHPTRRRVLAALGGLGIAAAPHVLGAKGKHRGRGTRVAAAGAHAPNRPEPVCFPGGDPPDCSGSLDVPAGVFCTFPVRLQISGKTKTIALPGGRTIVTAPGEKAILTHLPDGKQITVTITGALHTTTLPDGGTENVATGGNILLDPVAEPHFALAQGRFTFAFDKDGNLIRPRSGTGKLEDICALLA